MSLYPRRARWVALGSAASMLVLANCSGDEADGSGAGGGSGQDAGGMGGTLPEGGFDGAVESGGDSSGDAASGCPSSMLSRVGP